jgi:large repetitive protein
MLKKLLILIVIGMTLLSFGCRNRPPSNQRPRINNISPSKWTVSPGETITINCFASDDGRIEYSWSAQAGTFQDQSANPAQWTAPNSESSVLITVAVNDGQYTVSDTTSILVEYAISPVTGFSCTPGNGKLTLQWTNPLSTAFAGVEIRRKTDGFPISVTDGTLAYKGQDEAFEDISLANGTTYYYMIYAYNGINQYSEGVTASGAPTLSDGTPVAPSSLSGSPVSQTAIDLLWIDNSTDEVGFKIERKMGEAGTYAEIGLAGSNVSEYSDTQLDATTTYYYRVRAYNNAGNSVYTDEAIVMTYGPPVLAPNLSVDDIGVTSITIGWSDGNENETGFKIERKEGAGSFSQIDTVGVSAGDFEDTGLTADAAYTYRIRAYNTYGDSPYSNEVAATTNQVPDTTAPVPGAGGTLSFSGETAASVLVSWTAGSDDLSAASALQYQVYYSLADNIGSLSLVASNGTPFGAWEAQISSKEVTGLSPNTTYYFNVLIKDAAGNEMAYTSGSSDTLNVAPDAPDGLGISPVSGTALTLTWSDNSGNEDGFTIERRVGTVGDFAALTTVAANTTSYNDSGLVKGTDYYYRIFAHNSIGDSAFSPIESGTTPNNPASPFGLSASAVSTQQINLTWTDNSSDEVGFRIERKLGESGNYLEIATVEANSTSFSNTGLNPTTTYYYRVRAYNLAGSSNYTSEDFAVTFGPPMLAPNLSLDDVGVSSIDITWSDNNDNEEGFKIERKEGAGSFSQITTVGPTVSLYNDASLTPDITYTFRVRAYNTYGDSPYSNEITATTNEIPDTTAPTPGGGGVLSFSGETSSSITVNWSAGTDDVTTGAGLQYQVYFSLLSDISTLSLAKENGTPFASWETQITSKEVTGLSPDTTYYFNVGIKDGAGNETVYAMGNSATLDAAPDIPTGLAVSVVSGTELNLTWTDNSDNETGFRIERRVGTVGDFTELDTVTADITSYSDTGLTKGTAYYYQISAYNTQGSSVFTAPESATTPDNPGTPFGLNAAVISTSQIDLTWSDNSDNETGFSIERKEGESGTYEEITTVAAGTVSYSNTGLDATTSYYYQVRAFNLAGYSGYSAEAYATTLGPPMLAPNLGIDDVGTSNIEISWSDSNANEDEFKIERKEGSGSFSQIDTVTSSVTTYDDTGLDPDVAYTYRVRASNTYGDSPYSNEVGATTNEIPDTQVPTPGNSGALGFSGTTSSSVVVGWTAGSDDITAAADLQYLVYYSTGNQMTSLSLVKTNGTPFGTWETMITSKEVTGLGADTTYYFNVVIKDAAGNESVYTMGNSTTLDVPPNAPSGFGLTIISGTEISMSWIDNSDNESGFKIERSVNTNDNFTEIESVAENVISYNDTGLTKGTTYFYRVFAFNGQGDSGYSSIESVNTPDNPAAPTVLAATAVSTGQIDLTWTDNSSDETGFKIERREGMMGAYEEIGTAGADSVSFSNTGLDPSTEYYYQIKAYNLAGDSGYSNEADAITFGPPTDAPVLSLGTVETDSFTINWTDSNDNETGFEIERKEGAGSYGQIDTAASSVSTYEDTTVAPNILYTYRILATNTYGDSSYSNEVSATTPWPVGVWNTSVWDQSIWDD